MCHEAKKNWRRVLGLSHGRRTEWQAGRCSINALLPAARLPSSSCGWFRFFLVKVGPSCAFCVLPSVRGTGSDEDDNFLSCLLEWCLCRFSFFLLRTPFAILLALTSQLSFFLATEIRVVPLLDMTMEEFRVKGPPAAPRLATRAE